EYGPGRMAEPAEILTAIETALLPSKKLAGRHVIVTSGPTHEPIDPVRYLANRSSGRQGHSIAAALAELGARVTLVSGPVSIPDPAGVTTRRVESAAQMLAACQAALPADAAVFAAAVADWRVANTSEGKIKKQPGTAAPSLELVPNPDILATIAASGPARPRLVVGFAAGTDDLMANSQGKLRRKNADWIVANDVSTETGIMGGVENEIHLITPAGVEDWPRMEKQEVARGLAARIAEALPVYATEGAAGMDLLAAIDEPVLIASGQRVLIPTGLAIALPAGYALQIRPRSGLALRNGIVLPNSPGTIDEDYRGEIQVIVLNTGNEPFQVERGTRIAQAVLAPVVRG